ncbi:hypothetical protein ACJIZ3_024108 [Penstemon smallii]|uniref:Membrane protein insertion efficiency factor n=1 Tax=Penstemon smallii TaxID=265156 RepID=A0ABD3TRV6_9LAMI
MALHFSLNCKNYQKPFSPINPNLKLNPPQFSVQFEKHGSLFSSSTFTVPRRRRRRFCIADCSGEESGSNDSQDEEVNSLGVKAALSVLRFYKREVSPMLLKSCRYVPTCSEYSMIAYKKYGFAKGTILTTWRICRCNPLGGRGFDPPRWFGEATPPEP